MLKRENNAWPGIGLDRVYETSSYGWVDPKFDAPEETIKEIVETILTHGSF